jgi:hypothetical protein
MLAAAEAAMDMAAEDDAERQRNRARLYAPPGGPRRRTPGGTGRPRAAAGGMDLNAARAMMAQVASEDAKVAARRSG